MKKTASIIGLVLVFGIATYAYLLTKQIADVEALCSAFTEGAAVGDLRGLEDRYSLKLMGPFAVQDKPGTQEAIFCASMTLCDTSCSVEFQDGRVTKAEVWKL